MNEINYKKRNFIVVEILACTTFILNTICVITGKKIYGPGAPVWLPHFGLIYWLKTVLAVAGLFFFFRSDKKSSPRYVSFFTAILLWYSIPIVNFFLTWPFDFFLSGQFVLHGTDFNVNYSDEIMFKARISTQIVWSITMLIVAIDLFIKLLRKNKKTKI